jgi:hypothetical protein
MPEAQRFFIFPRKKAIFAMGRGHSLLCTTKIIFIFSGTFINARLGTTTLGTALSGVNKLVWTRGAKPFGRNCPLRSNRK